MNFIITYRDTRGHEKNLRVDARSMLEAEDIFLTMHPRYTIVFIRDVTNLVRNLGLQLY